MPTFTEIRKELERELPARGLKLEPGHYKRLVQLVLDGRLTLRGVIDAAEYVRKQKLEGKKILSAERLFYWGVNESLRARRKKKEAKG